MNRALRDVTIQGSYEKSFNLLTSDDLVHIAEEFEAEIETWFNVHGGTFIDIGANIGRYTVGLAKNFNQVYAFEPVKETFGTLKKNIHLNCLQNVVALPIGLWSCSDEKDINIGLNSGKSSMVLSIPNSHTQKIKVDTGDKIVESLGIRNVSLVKIDAEGAEVEILHGMKRLLYRDSPRVIVEIKKINHKKALDILKQIGYVLIGVRGENYLFEKKVNLQTQVHYIYELTPTQQTEPVLNNMIL